MYISVAAVLEMLTFERKKYLGDECKELSIIIAEPFFEVLLEEHNIKDRGGVRTLNMNVYGINLSISMAQDNGIGDKEFYLVLLGRPYYVNPDIIKDEK